MLNKNNEYEKQEIFKIDCSTELQKNNVKNEDQ